MAEQRAVAGGNTSIALTGAHDPFSDGLPLASWHCTMSVIDHPSRLSSHVICDHLMTILHEPAVPSLWKTRRSTGWMEAPMEHAPHTFRSFLPEERITALQSTSKNRFVRGGHGQLLRSFP